MAIGLFKVGEVRSYKWMWITVGHLQSHKSAGDVFRLYREVPKKKSQAKNSNIQLVISDPRLDGCRVG